MQSYSNIVFYKIHKLSYDVFRKDFWVTKLFWVNYDKSSNGPWLTIQIKLYLLTPIQVAEVCYNSGAIYTNDSKLLICCVNIIIMILTV